MIQRGKMDTRSWGKNKSDDREYAKALADHARSGSTAELVEVEIGVGVEVTGQTISNSQIDDVTELITDNATYSRTAQVSNGDRRCVDLMADLHNFLKQRGYL